MFFFSSLLNNRYNVDLEFNICKDTDDLLKSLEYFLRIFFKELLLHLNIYQNK